MAFYFIFDKLTHCYTYNLAKKKCVKNMKWADFDQSLEWPWSAQQVRSKCAASVQQPNAGGNIQLTLIL